jgi:hypothetical protein
MNSSSPTMKETTDHLENIVDIILAARKKNTQIGARLKHFYSSPDSILVQLTGKGWVKIDTLVAENGVSELKADAIQKVVDSFEMK